MKILSLRMALIRNAPLKTLFTKTKISKKLELVTQYEGTRVPKLCDAIRIQKQFQKSMYT